MAVIDIVMPSARGVEDETRITLLEMINHTQCRCGNHLPWECNRGKHDVMWLPPFGTSIVHWTRNFLLSMSLYSPHRANRPKPDFILLMDDDMVVRPNFLKQLLSHNLDFVSGICTSRRDPPIPNIRFWKPDKAAFITPTEWNWNTQKLIEPDAVGAAFVLVKRRVLESITEAYLDCVFDKDEDLRKGYPPELVEAYWSKKSLLRKERFKDSDWKKRDAWWFQFYDNIDDRQIGEIGEDLTFSVKAKKLGYRIFADPCVRPGHIGKYAYGLDDHIYAIEAAKERGEEILVTDNNPMFEQPMQFTKKEMVAA